MKNALIRRAVRQAIRTKQSGLGARNVPVYSSKRTEQEAVEAVTRGQRKPMKAEKAARWASKKVLHPKKGQGGKA